MFPDRSVLMPEVDTTSLLRRLRALTLADLEDLEDATLRELDRTVGRLSIGRVLRPRDDDIVLAGSDDEYPATHALAGTDVEIAYYISDQDLVLRVNKGDCQIFRVRLADALMILPESERLDFPCGRPRLRVSGRQPE
jgi:hypothetical protein